MIPTLLPFFFRQRPSTKRVLLLVVHAMCMNVSFAQVASVPNSFYPLHVGDIRQYEDEFGSLLTTTITSDTSVAGFEYFLYQGVALKSSSIAQRVDSSGRVVNLGFGATTPIYRFNETPGSIWPVSSTFWGLPTPQPLVRFDSSYTTMLFGHPTRVMRFSFGGPVHGGPTDTIWGFGAIAAEGIGIVQEVYYETESRTLVGALIDGQKVGTVVSVKQSDPNLPASLELLPNYPNPFNATTTIRFSSPAGSFIDLSVFDLMGHKVTTLVRGLAEDGVHEFRFSAPGLSTGIYVAVLTSSGKTQSRKLLLLK